MRFFEQPEQARKQALKLLMLFGVTVFVLLLAVNAALALSWRVVTPGFSSCQPIDRHAPAVQHMLLVSANTQTRWFASHPPHLWPPHGRAGCAAR